MSDESVEQIAVRIAAALFHLTPEKVMSKNREILRAEARFVVFTLLHERGLNYSEIARRMGGRDHGTVISGIRRAAEFAETDKRFAERLKAARRAFLALMPA